VLKQMKMGSKILAAFGFAIAAMVVIGGIAWSNAAAIQASLEDVSNAKFPSVAALAELNEGQTAVARGLNTLLLRRADAELRADAKKAIDAAFLRMDEGAKRYEALPHSEEALRSWTQAKDALATWRTRLEAVLAPMAERDGLLRAGTASDDPAIVALDTRVWNAFLDARKEFGPAEQALDEIIALTQRQAEETSARGDAAASSGIRTIAVSIALGAALLSAFGFVLSRSISRTVSNLVSEAGRLRDAVSAGKLDVRGDLEKVDHEFQPIVQGVNETMDAYAKPIGVTVDYVTRISNGEIPAPITERYEGDFNRIKDALNRCIGAVNALVSDAGGLVAAAKQGKLATRADATRHQGDFRKIVQGVNETLDAVVGPLNVAARYVEEISRGAIPARITDEYRGDFDVLKRNLNTCIDAVNLLVSDAGTLVAAAVQGRLSTRADAARHQGDFRKIVQGVNDTLDAVIGPLNVAAKYVDDISKGAIPAKISAEYHGDFDLLKQNLNACIDAVKRLVADADRLAQAAVEGALDTRADASQHQGDFRKIVEGVNRTLDAVLAPVEESARVLEQLAARDLRARVRGEYRGGHARIKESVNATGEALGDALSQVAAAVDQVSSAATQIAASSQAVASGASEQASSLQETSSSVESVSGMTKQAADNAQQANQLAQTARGAATEGAASVEQMQASMGRIKASAEGTSQIIKDVSDIAFQTNLLALNAAVEAARAGEAGRGFAVVAEEVRSLALRAKEAAQKTEELIRQSVKEAADGEVTARHVAGKLGEIVGGISKVTDIVSEIATAAREQAAGIDQVNKAVSEMDKVTQQNAASAEESSSAASELSGQAEELAAMVGAFQLERRAAVAVAAPARRAPPKLPAKAPAPAKAPTNGHPHPAITAKADPFPMDDLGKDF